MGVDYRCVQVNTWMSRIWTWMSHLFMRTLHVMYITQNKYLLTETSCRLRFVIHVKASFYHLSLLSTHAKAKGCGDLVSWDDEALACFISRRITESWRLVKPLKVIKSNCQHSTTTMFTIRSCPQVLYPHGLWTLPEMITPPLPCKVFSDALQNFLWNIFFPVI